MAYLTTTRLNEAVREVLHQIASLDNARMLKPRAEVETTFDDKWTFVRQSGGFYYRGGMRDIKFADGILTFSTLKTVCDIDEVQRAEVEAVYKRWNALGWDESADRLSRALDNPELFFGKYRKVTVRHSVEQPKFFYESKQTG